MVSISLLKLVNRNADVAFSPQVNHTLCQAFSSGWAFIGSSSIVRARVVCRFILFRIDSGYVC